MESQSSIGNGHRQTSNFSVLLGNFNWRRSSQEVEIENTTNGVVFQVLLAVGILVNEDIHTVGVEEEDSMGA